MVSRLIPVHWKIQRALPFLMIAAAFGCVNSTACARDVLSAADVERAGLNTEWFTQIQSSARNGIVNLQLQINENITTRYYLIEYDGRVERISQHDLDAFGKPRGIEGAEAYANYRREIILAELAAQRRPKVEVRIRAISLPKTTIYAVDASGRVSAVDADSGKLLWSTPVGDRRYPTTGIGAANDHVAVVNASKLYCLSADEGRILWSRQCRNAPSAEPAVSETAIYVPLIDGRLEVFNLADEGSFPNSMISFGASIAKPLVTENTVSWATNTGHYSVAPIASRGVSYRLDSGNRFVAGGAADSGLLFVNTFDGSVFAIDEQRGSIVWEYATGRRIIEPPFVRSGNVFVISADHKMFKIDANSGQLASGWEVPLDGISRFVGLSKERIYALDAIGQLVSVDFATGAKLATIASPPLTLVLPNIESDRLYVGSEGGLLQCLRETGNPFPIFHADDVEKMLAKDGKMEQDKADAESGKVLPKSDDPFATDSDPFAADGSDEKSDPFASDNDAGDSDDPFASDDDAQEDPPTNESSGENDDPFGGGDSTGGDSTGGDNDDPFGGGDSPSGGADDPPSGGEDDDDPFAGG